MIPEYIIEICVAIDIAILGIAYPIIVDKISNIGDKFSSQYIPVLFNWEFPQKSIKILINKKEYKISIFKLTLYSTLFSFFFLIFKLPPLFGWNNWFINNSANYLVLFLTTLLTIFFFIWLDKVVLYNGKSKSILKHIINRYDSLNNNVREIKDYHLKAINELTFYALEKQDEHLQETLLEFYYRVFTGIRKSHDKTKPLIYPIDLYFLVNKLNEESVNIENKKLRAIEHRAVSGNWLIGEDLEYISISEETYNWLWRNIYTICDDSRLIKMFWSNSSQFFDFRLEKIFPDYDFENGGIKNQEEIDRRKNERNQFLEFHYALGGLLLYRKQYKVFKYLFQYSQSIPPKYVLLPETMTQIFEWFENFRNEFKNRKTSIDIKYSFPELDNLGNRGQVIYWICSYLTVLFIRQYSLHKYYTFQNFTALPNLPDDIIELSNWLDSVSYFEKCLKDILANENLISELEYNSIVEEKRDEFNTFITELKEAITTKIGKQKLEAPLSDEKIDIFYAKSKEIVTKAFDDYNAIFVEKTEEYEKCELKLSINGAKTLLSKSAFTDGDVPHLYYDTIFAESIATDKIKRLIPNAFTIASTKRYLLNLNNLILGLEKIIGGKNDIVIVGVNIGHGLNEILEKSAFSKIILSIPSTAYQLQDVLFILKRSDLPAIEHREIKEEEIKELQLVAINSDLNIYASVIDINKEENESIKEKWNIEDEPDKLDFKVQISISFVSVLYWKNDRNIIQLDIASAFKEQGIQNDINDIEPLK